LKVDRREGTPMSKVLPTSHPKAASLLAWILLLGSPVAVCFGSSAEASWREAVRQADALQLRGEYAAAEAVLLPVLRNREQLQLKDTTLAQVLNTAGGLYAELGRLDEAEHYWRGGLSLWSGSSDSSHVIWPRIANNLVALYTHAQQTARGEKLANRLLNDRREILEKHPSEWAELLHNVGSIHFLRGDLKMAESFYRRALQAHDSHFDLKHPKRLFLLVSLASVLTGTGRSGEARRCLEEALQIGEAHFGATHRYLARGLIALAAAHRLNRDLPEAERAVLRAITIIHTDLGPEHPLLIDAWSEYARVVKLSGRKNDAKAAEKQARAIQDREKQLRSSTGPVDVSELTGFRPK
jgi:tetratricopeptide (TPR) repeat protein